MNNLIHSVEHSLYNFTKENQKLIHRFFHVAPSLNASLTSVETKKTSGSITAYYGVVGTQLDANRICVYVPFPFIMNLTTYTVSISSCTLLGVASISTSDITVDDKKITGVRLMIAKTGTVRDSYAVELAMTISA